MSLSSQFFHVLVFVAVGCLIALVPLAASALFRERGAPLDKSPYECGMDAVGTPWVSPNIRFYLFGLLFVVFDVEALFVFPWAVNVRALGVPGLAAVLIFVGILLAGLVFAWKKGALKWE